jgi:hypothetical protein
LKKTGGEGVAENERYASRMGQPLPSVAREQSCYAYRRTQRSRRLAEMRNVRPVEHHAAE